MKKLWLRICSMVLVMVMVMNSLPLNAWAEQNQAEQTEAAQASETETISTEEVEDLSQKEVEEIVKEAKVVDELSEERTEYTKKFLMDSGLFMAVVYDSAVHYEENGQWKDIDNTLITKTDGTITNTAGVWDVSFPQQLSRNNKVSITKDGYTLSFGMAGELRKQDYLEIMSVGDEDPVAQASVNAEKIESEATEPESTTEATTIATETEPITEATTPTEEVPTVTVPEEEEMASEGSVVETETIETAPETYKVDETQLEETVPETKPQDKVEPTTTVSEIETTAPPATIPQETVSVELASVKVNGITETFAVNSAKTVIGDVQKLDFAAAYAEAEYKETVLTKNVSQLKYVDVYTNTDVQYDIKGNTVKESLVLDAYDSKLRGYRFTIDAGEMVPVMNEDQSIHFYDKEKRNVVMTMPAPFLMDKEMNISHDVQLSLTQNGTEYTLVYLLPQEWLASEERAWPVVLDPAVVADLSDNNIADAIVIQKRPTEHNSTLGTLQIGYSENSKITRSYLKFIDLPSLSSANVIINAQFSLKKIGSVTTPVPATIHKVTQSWNVSGLCWNNKPAFDTTIADYTVIKGAARYYWDITDIVQSWYASANNGLMVKASDTIEQNADTNYWKEFYSSDYGGTSTNPWLIITYRNSTGLESYWDYTSSNAGRAGTGYVNNFTGNLVWVHDDIGFGET